MSPVDQSQAGQTYALGHRSKDDGEDGYGGQDNRLSYLNRRLMARNSSGHRFRLMIATVVDVMSLSIGLPSSKNNPSYNVVGAPLTQPLLAGNTIHE